MKVPTYITENWGKETISAAVDNKANSLAEATAKVNQHRIIARERIDQKINDIRIKLENMQTAALNSSKDSSLEPLV